MTLFDGFLHALDGARFVLSALMVLDGSCHILFKCFGFAVLMWHGVFPYFQNSNHSSRRVYNPWEGGGIILCYRTIFCHFLFKSFHFQCSSPSFFPLMAPENPSRTTPKGSNGPRPARPPSPSRASMRAGPKETPTEA